MLPAFIKVRLSAQGFLSLHFIVAVMVLIISSVLFGVIAENVVRGHAFTIADAQIAQWLHAHGSPILTECLLVLTHLHDPITISFIVGLLTLYLITKKQWHAVLTLLLAVPGGMLLNLLVKEMIHRPRPSFEHPLVLLTTYSFPSGHVAAATLFYGTIAALLISQTTKWSHVMYILSIAFVMVLLVAFSRLYLGAHYLSDVLAAFFEATAWLALCQTVIYTFQIHLQTKRGKK